jgi:hypothetical protein
VNAEPSAGEVGEPAAVQLGFDDHGLGKLFITAALFDAHLADSLARSPSVPPVSHTDYANAHQTGFPQSRLRFRLWSSDHKLTRRRQSTHLRMQRAIARLHPKRPYLHQVKVVLELCNQVVLAFEQAGALHLVATQEFDRLQLQEVLLGPRWIEDD